jgi:nitrate/nitrite transporter NarK
MRATGGGTQTTLDFSDRECGVRNTMWIFVLMFAVLALTIIARVTSRSSGPVRFSSFTFTLIIILAFIFMLLKSHDDAIRRVNEIERARTRPTINQNP